MPGRSLQHPGLLGRMSKQTHKDAGSKAEVPVIILYS